MSTTIQGIALPGESVLRSYRSGGGWLHVRGDIWLISDPGDVGYTDPVPILRFELISVTRAAARSLGVYELGPAPYGATFHPVRLTHSALDPTGLVLVERTSQLQRSYQAIRVGADGTVTIGAALVRTTFDDYVPDVGCLALLAGRRSDPDFTMVALAVAADLTLSPGSATAFTTPGARRPNPYLDRLSVAATGRYDGSASYVSDSGAGFFDTRTGTIDAALTSSSLPLPWLTRTLAPAFPLAGLGPSGDGTTWLATTTAITGGGQATTYWNYLLLLDGDATLLDTLSMFDLLDGYGGVEFHPFYDDAGQAFIQAIHQGVSLSIFTVSAGRFTPVGLLVEVYPGVGGPALDGFGGPNGAGTALVGWGQSADVLAHVSDFEWWPLVAAPSRPIPLRLGCRDDGLGPGGHPRLGGSTTSAQAVAAPRLGQTYY